MKKVMLFQVVALSLSLNAWAAEAVPQKSQLQEMYKKLSDQAFGSPMKEKIEEAKKLALPAPEEARQIRVILENYLEPGPTKVKANDICSAQGPKFNAYFKDEVFSFNQSQDPTSKNTHTTEIRYKKSFAKEKEDFVQVGTSQVTENGTTIYAVSDGVKEAPVEGVNIPIRMIDQFVNTEVLPQQDSKSALKKTDHALLKTELEKTWNFFKRVGACCAVNGCKTALKAQISISPKLNGPAKPASPAQTGAH